MDQRNITPDVCIVGSGPSGLATALRAASNGQSVVIIESGDGQKQYNEFCKGKTVSSFIQPDTTDKKLVQGPSIYDSDYLEKSRVRDIGGSSRKWGVRPFKGGGYHVRIARPEVQDFAASLSLDCPSWPLPENEISSYLDQASQFLKIPNPDFSANSAPEGLDFDDGVFQARYFHITEASVIHDWNYHKVDSLPNTTFFTGFNFVALKTNQNRSRVQSIELADQNDQKYILKPKILVLACGGIENARVLLNAAEDGQIEDPNDLLGRWCMDHPHASMGAIELFTEPEKLGEFHDFQKRNGDWVLGHYGLNPEYGSSYLLPRFSITLVGAPRCIVSPAASALVRLARGQYQQSTKNQLFRDFTALCKYPSSALKQIRYKTSRGNMRHHTALGGWSRAETRVTDVDVLRIESMLSQRPSRDNRVKLGKSKDRYGQYFPQLQWSWSDMEVEAYWRAVDITKAQFSKLGLGKYYSPEDLGSGSIPHARTGWHQMGGTRMSKTTTDGSVDKDCRYHQLDNLYVSGPSIFPNSIGFANPTLTSIAFSLRLGDHLAS